MTNEISTQDLIQSLIDKRVLFPQKNKRRLSPRLDLPFQSYQEYEDWGKKNKYFCGLELADNWVAIDIDNRVIADAVLQLQEILNDPLIIETPRGIHLFYEVPEGEGETLRTGKQKFCLGFEAEIIAKRITFLGEGYKTTYI